MNKLKSVNFILSNSLGGAEYAFLNYNNILLNNNFDNFSFVKKGSKLCKTLENSNSKIYKIGIFSINKIKKQLENINPNFILVHKNKDLKIVKKYAPKHCKIIFVAHAFKIENIEIPDVIIAVSNAVKHFLIKNSVKQQISIIPNCITVEECQYQFNQIPIIATISLLRKNKNVEMFIRALSILKQRGIKFRAIIAGSGYRLPLLRLFAITFGLLHEIDFCGLVKDKKKFYSLIDICCVTSNYETFNLTLIEAMAHKKVVISTNCQGPSDIIIQNKTGELVPINNPIALANSIENILKNPELAKQYATCGYERAKNIYDISVVSKQFIDIAKAL